MVRLPFQRNEKPQSAFPNFVFCSMPKQNLASSASLHGTNSHRNMWISFRASESVLFPSQSLMYFTLKVAKELEGHKSILLPWPCTLYTQQHIHSTYTLAAQDPTQLSQIQLCCQELALNIACGFRIKSPDHEEMRKE